MRITIGNPDQPDATIHTGGRNVHIHEAFVGPLFTTDTGETLGVCMRDSGYEITYQAPGHPERWLSLNDGVLRDMGGDVALLGLATTRQLLEEIAARCDIGSIDSDPAGLVVQASVKLALDLLAAEALDYRTADHG